ncbi:Uncharacterised protein [Campylobacter geochelonis]|nr:Uncharacterised protein [Campylobacter geochelonis]CZE50174.1 Uncharacterised protein [Campylobacter geochelonis]
MQILQNLGIFLQNYVKTSKVIQKCFKIFSNLQKIVQTALNAIQ